MKDDRIESAGEDQSFDLVRINKAKDTVDLCANTIRSFAKQGLRLYKAGKNTFFSKVELRAFIISRRKETA